MGQHSQKSLNDDYLNNTMTGMWLWFTNYHTMISFNPVEVILMLHVINKKIFFFKFNIQ